jgi:hypothetical protein
VTANAIESVVGAMAIMPRMAPYAGSAAADGGSFRQGQSSCSSPASLSTSREGKNPPRVHASTRGLCGLHDLLEHGDAGAVADVADNEHRQPCNTIPQPRLLSLADKTATVLQEAAHHLRSSCEIPSNGAIPLPMTDFIPTFPRAQTPLQLERVTRARQPHLRLDAYVPCLP